MMMGALQTQTARDLQCRNLDDLLAPEPQNLEEGKGNSQAALVLAVKY